jgi:uncharacterized protein
MQRHRHAFLIATLLSLSWMLASPVRGAPPGARVTPPLNLEVMDWPDLLPEKERIAYENDEIFEHDYLGEGGPAADQSGSSAIRAELGGKLVKIPGFIVPLNISSEGWVSEFFLVPYFGACIHVPPPPPNQIVYVKMEKGFRLHSIYDPKWITGTLNSQTKSLPMASAAYSMTAQRVEAYE